MRNTISESFYGQKEQTIIQNYVLVENFRLCLLFLNTFQIKARNFLNPFQKSKIFKIKQRCGASMKKLLRKDVKCYF